MKKIIIFILLFEIITYNSQNLLMASSVDSLSPQPRLPKRLLPNARPARDNSESNSDSDLDSDIDDIPPLTVAPARPANQNPPAQPVVPPIFTADSLGITRTSNNDVHLQDTSPSLFSRIFTNLSNTTSELLFGKNFEDEYWKTFDMDTKLKEFQDNVSNENNCTKIIINLIQEINEQLAITSQILFDKYLAVDQEIMKNIEPYLAKGTKITAFPSSENVLITTPYGTEGSLENVIIPQKNISKIPKNYLTKIESVWLLNLHINYTKSDFIYTHFNYLKFKTNMMSAQETIKNTKTLQDNINYLYQKDLSDLKKRRDIVLNFIFEKFISQTPEVDKILYSIPYPNITQILFKKDTPEEQRRKSSNFTKFFQSANEL